MKKLLLNLIGPLFAAIGVFGLAGSGIVWNFQGRSVGLPSTVISLLVLLLGFVLLRPFARASASISASASAPAAPSESEDRSEVRQKELDPASGEMKWALTTAESIEQELAESQKLVEVALPVNFASEMLLPGQGLPNRRRRPGASLKLYKTMVGELFDTK